MRRTKVKEEWEGGDDMRSNLRGSKRPMQL